MQNKKDLEREREEIIENIKELLKKKNVAENEFERAVSEHQINSASYNLLSINYALADAYNKLKKLGSGSTGIG